MFFYTIDEGHKVLARSRDGRMQVLTGPARVPVWGRTFEKMKHFVAHPGQFLEIRFRDDVQRPLVSFGWVEFVTNLVACYTNITLREHRENLWGRQCAQKGSAY